MGQSGYIIIVHFRPGKITIGSRKKSWHTYCPQIICKFVEKRTTVNGQLAILMYLISLKFYFLSSNKNIAHQSLPPPSTAYMGQWTGSALVQIMACRLIGAKPLSEPMLIYCQLGHRNKFQWIFNLNSNFAIQENAFKKRRLRNGGILSRVR